jgi:hypothetical protein
MLDRLVAQIAPAIRCLIEAFDARRIIARHAMNQSP